MDYESDNFDENMDFEVDDIADELEYEETEKTEKVDTNSLTQYTHLDILEKMKKKPKKTTTIMTKFEKARIIGVRLQQLNNGAQPCVNVSKLRNNHEIVLAELEQRKIPFIIKRPLPDGTSEYWKIEEFEVI
jgi:DNA-directed RNA polymerase I, II, and III subunit RPABC2